MEQVLTSVVLAGGVPEIALIVGLLFVPESPRWLVCSPRFYAIILRIVFPLLKIIYCCLASSLFGLIYIFVSYTLNTNNAWSIN